MQTAALTPFIAMFPTWTRDTTSVFSFAVRNDLHVDQHTVTHFPHYTISDRPTLNMQMLYTKSTDERLRPPVSNGELHRAHGGEGARISASAFICFRMRNR